MKTTALFLLFGLFAALTWAGELPRKAPDMAIALPSGKQVKLSDYAGKVVIVTFILTDCPHCQKTTQMLTGIQKDLGPKGLQVLEGTINPGADVPAFIQRFKPSFPVGVADRVSVAGLMQFSSNQRLLMPLMAFIGRNGMLQAEYTGSDSFLQNEEAQDANIRAEALKLLSERTPGRTSRRPTAHK